VPNDGGQLKPGTFARVRLETALVERVVTLPYSAMQYRYGVNRAFVVRDNRLTVRELKIGDRIGDRIEILGGVDPGDLIALSDVDNLADGMAVAIDRSAE
jgi:multidrug efflux pump subunit AcrA (membrane-fusion protein)